MNFHTQVKGNILEEISRQLEAQQVLADTFPSLADFLSRKFCTHGEDFVKRLEIFGCTEQKDDKLKLSQWTREFASGIADLRIYHCLTTGSAQIGKTLFNTLFLTDFATFVGLSVAWFYPTKTQVDTLVPVMFRPVARSYLQNVKEYFAKNYNKVLDLTSKEDKQSNSVFQIKGTTIYFRYASTSGKDHTEQRKGLAVVGGSGSSISANILFIEERSQIPPEAVGTLFRRLDAARLPGGLVRELGTPGSGLGIEAVMDNAQYHFYPHIYCEHCKNIIAIDAKGCLIKPLPGDPFKYLSTTGRPVDWFYKDPNNKIDSAYFACPKCHGEISKESRLSAHFRCLKTKKTWRKLQSELPNTYEEAIKNRLLVSFQLSPMLRDTKFDLAVNIIRTGMGYEGVSAKDFQQQMLGHKSESDTFAITKEMLLSAMKNPFPTTRPTCTVAGIDQGRGSDYVTIMQVWVDGFKFAKDKIFYESNGTGSAIQCIENAHRRVVFCGAVHRKTIPGLLKNYKVNYAIADNEPDIAEMYTLSKSTCIELADQKVNLLQIVKEIMVFGGSLEIPAYGIYADYFKDALLSSYVDNRVSIFEFDVNDKNQDSIAKHLTVCEKDPITLKWERPDNHVDDIFFSSMFAEAALFIHITKHIELAETSIAWVNKINEQHLRVFS